MNLKNNCVLMSSKIENEKRVKRSYKTDYCIINVTSIFETDKSIKDALSYEINRNIKIDFKLV